MKVCNKCNKKQSLNCFYDNYKMRGGKGNTCKTCISKQHKKTYKRRRKSSIKDGKKKCNKCEKWKELKYYHQDKRRGYYFSTCKECRKLIHREQYVAKREIMVKDGKRKCSICNKWLDENTNFIKRRGSCNKCAMDKRLRKTYGIGENTYQNMLEAQGGKCAICGGLNGNNKYGTIKNLCVDHCHTTGKIRGLLCDSCNTGLGKFKDHIELLEKAINYLK